jgi:hypothetical protein
MNDVTRSTDPTSDPLAWLESLEGVPSAYAAARDGIDVVLRDRGLRRTSPETTAESLLRGAHASAVLEGSTSSPAEMREGAGDDVAQAALRVSTELLGSALTLGRSPAQALARIHALAAAGSVADHELGRPRDAAAAERLQAVAALLRSSTSVPALIVAAVVHADLAASAPFASHNGIVARAVERLVLVARGVDEKSLVVPEAGHLALRSAYESNLRGYRDGGRAGVHSWLLYAAEAYTAGAQASPVND